MSISGDLPHYRTFLTIFMEVAGTSMKAADIYFHGSRNITTAESTENVYFRGSLSTFIQVLTAASMDVEATSWSWKRQRSLESEVHDFR